MVGLLVGHKKKERKKEWTLEGVWVPEKAGLLSKKDYQMSKRPLKT